MRTCQGVGLTASRFQIIAAPGADAGVSGRKEEGENLQAADPRFATPIVSRCPHRRRQPHDVVIGEQVLHELAFEGRAIVAFDEQRRSVFGEERGQDESRAGGFHVRDRQPG